MMEDAPSQAIPPTDGDCADRRFGRTRIPALDGLRGAAAASVVVYHCWCYPFANVQLPTVPFVGALWNGNEAVLVFFVISGFVLSLPSWQGAPQSYGDFVIRRLFRIYPAYVASVAVSFAISAVAGTLWGGSGTAGSVFGALASDVAMLDIDADMEPDPPIWSLVQEMRISLAIPLLVWLVGRIGWIAVPAAFGLSFIAGFLPTEPQFVTSVARTLRCVWPFVAGVYMARHLPAIQSWGARQNGITQVTLLCLALLCVSIDPYTAPFSSFLRIGAMIAAGPFVGCVVAFPIFRRLFGSTVALFLGTISYSLYLLHDPIIIATGTHLPRPIWPILPVVASVVASLIMYELVERPGITLGRRIAHRLAGASTRVI